MDIFRQLKILLVASIILLTLPLCLLTLPVFAILRLAVWSLAKLFYPQDYSEMVQGKSAILAVECQPERTKMNLVVSLVMEGAADLESCRSRFRKNVMMKRAVPGGKLLYPQFKQSLSVFCGFRFWKWDRNFDLDEHIRMYDYEDEEELLLPEHGCSVDDYERIMGGLLARAWRENQSPWEILLIPDYQDGNKGEDDRHKTLLVIRFHHSLCDGHSIQKVLLQDLSDAPGAAVEPSFSRGSIWGSLIFYFVLPIKMPYDLASSLVDNYDEPSEWHLTGSKLSRRYITCFSKLIPVSILKEIRVKYRVSYNSVLSALLCGGFRRMMQDSGQRVPGEMGCFVVLPLPDHPGGLVNHASGTSIKWPIGIESSTTRLKTISQRLTRSKLYMGMLGFDWFTKFFAYGPVLYQQMIRDKMNCTVALSSFAGPEVDPYIWGQPLSEVIAGTGLPSGKLGVSVVAISSRGQQRFVVTFDKTVCKDEKAAYKLSGFIQEEVNELLLSKCNEDV